MPMCLSTIVSYVIYSWEGSVNKTINFDTSGFRLNPIKQYVEQCYDYLHKLMTTLVKKLL